MTETRYIVRLPPGFIRDSIESGCDVGEYEKGCLCATAAQIAELRDRAEYYADPNGPDMAPWLKWPAKALLRALNQRDPT